MKGIVNKIEVLPSEKAMSDKHLKEVLTNILENQFPLEENVTFKVENGIVTVNGTTTNLWAKENIVKEFSTVIGIKKVINNLEVEKTME